MPPPCYAIGRGVARGARCPTAQGFRISISRVLLVIHSLLYASTPLSLSLSPRSPPFRRFTELGCEQLEGEWRGAREGRVHQEVPAKAQERRTFTSRANTRTCTHQRCETLPGPQPSNLQISPFFFLPFHSSPIPHRLRFVLSASNLSSETYDSLVRAQDLHL